MSESIRIAVCDECLLASEYGVDEAVYDDHYRSPGEAKRRRAEIAAGFARELDHDVVGACGEDCEGGFSSSPCDLCRSPLAGHRHPADLVPNPSVTRTEVGPFQVFQVTL